jgi:hypothetical protein
MNTAETREQVRETDVTFDGGQVLHAYETVSEAVAWLGSQ